MQIENEPIRNRVDESGIVTFNLEDYFPTVEMASFDLQPFLFQGLILREKDYRKALQETDWSKYAHKAACVHCSADAIIPIWAFMLAATYLQPLATTVFYGTEEQFIQQAMSTKLMQLDWASMQNQRVVVKGCGDKPVPAGVYLAVTNLLLPVAKSIMYGEPCSTVPVFKKALS